MRQLIFILTIVLNVAFTSLSMAQSFSYPPRPEAITALVSSPEIAISSLRDQLITFRPTGETNPTKGIIIYPGAFVDIRAYAPLARDLANEGFVAVIVKMPLDVAFLGYKRALLAQYVNRDIRKWAVGGHSLGGVAACTFAKEFQSLVDGVALLASYPSPGDSLRFSSLSVISIYGTRDGLTDATDINKSKRLLPRSSMFTAIEGGNHTQFGAYWDGVNPNFVQPGDQTATISANEQQAQIVDAIVSFLNLL